MRANNDCVAHRLLIHCGSRSCRVSMRLKLAELGGPRDRDLRGQKKNRRSTGEPPFSLNLWWLASLFLAALFVFLGGFGRLIATGKRSELLVMLVCTFTVMN